MALAPIPGQEQANCDALVGQGAARHAPGPAEALELTEQLLSSPTRREQMRQAALGLGQPSSAHRAARVLLDRSRAQ